MTIQAETIEQMTEIVAGLVREGLTFKAAPYRDGWLITLLGGY